MADPILPPDTISYNCDCADATVNTRTLLQLREDCMIDLGYSQQLAAPPTGIVLKINRALQRAQRFLYLEYDEFRASRYYTWDLAENVRFYDIDANEDACTKKLSADKIEWAGISDGDRWYPLVYGIPPVFYSDPATVGRPYRYEVRQCIELWPTPEVDTLRLRIKGAFGLTAFAADGDSTTLDGDLVFNWAMYMLLNASGKSTQGEPYLATAQRIIEQRTSAGHVTARYIPGTVVISPEPRPIFLGLDE